MKLRYLVSAALLGGLVSFAWGAASHVSMLLPSLEPKAFADSTAVLQTIHANAPENGIYFDGRGLFAAVSFRPDLSQRFASLVGPTPRRPPAGRPWPGGSPRWWAHYRLRSRSMSP